MLGIRGHDRLSTPVGGRLLGHTMSEPKPFSLAVLKGINKGAVLRTVRKRISVGAADDNDLVLTDPEIAPRHFLVLIDAGRWRIHTLSPDHRITVDRRWAHPQTGKRGALIRAAGAELLLFPGPIDDVTVESEIKMRETGAFAMPDTNEELVTSVHAQPVEFRSDMRGDETRELIEMSQAATIAGDRPPDDLRDAARSALRDERQPVAPSVLREQEIENVEVKTTVPRKSDDPFEERTIGVRWENGTPVPHPIAGGGPAPAKPKKKKGGNAWDRSRKVDEKTDDFAVPEVLAQPESQMQAIPGSAKSVMTARPDFATGGAQGSQPAQVISVDSQPSTTSGRKRKNAWGDPSETRPPDPAATPMPKSRGGGGNAWGDGGQERAIARRNDKPRNAWGDTVAPEERPPEPPRPSRSSGGNKWGDDRRNSGPTSSPGNAPSGRRSIQPRKQNGAGAIAVGVRRTIQELQQSSQVDPATQILRAPDGQFATACRLLAARLEEFAKNLGYRAYMLSSPEPLTGKTTSALNLAFALGEDTHRRVALMEADFRYPRFAEILGIDERQGVLGVVEGRAQLSDSVVKVADRNLVILPAGGRHPHPGEVLASPRFKTLIAELVNTVDIAILDAPSVAPFADTNMLLPLVDAAFLIVADGVTKTSTLAAARAQLGENRILGALYNHIPKKVASKLTKERKERLKQR